jgi:hypothetical protein
MVGGTRSTAGWTLMILLASFTYAQGAPKDPPPGWDRHISASRLRQACEKSESCMQAARIAGQCHTCYFGRLTNECKTDSMKRHVEFACIGPDAARDRELYSAWRLHGDWRRCWGDPASAQTPESAEVRRNCNDPLTTDEFHREVKKWLERNKKYEGREISEAEADRQTKAMQQILKRERERRAPRNR